MSKNSSSEFKRAAFLSVLVLGLSFFLLAVSVPVLAAPDNDAIEKAKELHLQAKALHEQGRDQECIRLSRQALETFKGAYTDKKIISSISNILDSIEKMEKDPAGAAPICLLYLEKYFSDETLKQLDLAEKLSAVKTEERQEVRKNKEKRRPRYSEQEEAEQIEKANTLYEQAQSRYEQGDYNGTIGLAQQAIEIYSELKACKSARRIVRQTVKMAKYHIATGDSAGAATTYLQCLRTYENQAKAQTVYERKELAEKERMKQQIKEFAKARNKQMLQGNLDNDAFRAQVEDLVKDSFPKRKAMEMEKVSHFNDFSYEHIDPSKEFDHAVDLFQKVLSFDKKILNAIIDFIPEKEKLDFLATKQNNLNAFLSLALEFSSQYPDIQKIAFDTWITRKGMLLEAQRQFQEALIDSGDPEEIKAFQELNQIRVKISNILFSQLGKDKTSDLSLSELEKKKEKLEDKLSRLSQAYATKKQVEKANTEEIAACLPPGSVLLDFARVRMRNFLENRWRPARYMVFVLHAGAGKKPIIIDLGKADKIDNTISRFKSRVADEEDISNQGADLLRASWRLYNLVFAPILDSLAGVKKIYISPDGNLNLIPFEVLQAPQGKFLIEEYSFDYLAASRDILSFSRTRDGAGKSVIIGNPDFNTAGKNIQGETSVESLTGQGVALKQSGGMRKMRFDPLPDTREEIHALKTLLGARNVVTYEGADASEACLFRQSTPRILHLATHGFFLDDQDLAALSHDNGGEVKVSTEPLAPEAFMYENPLLRSGIALAGANTTLGADARDSQGIVTAEKILGLRLQGTEMVVLSAPPGCV